MHYFSRDSNTSFFYFTSLFHLLPGQRQPVCSATSLFNHFSFDAFKWTFRNDKLARSICSPVCSAVLEIISLCSTKHHLGSIPRPRVWLIRKSYIWIQKFPPIVQASMIKKNHDLVPSKAAAWTISWSCSKHRVCSQFGLQICPSVRIEGQWIAVVFRVDVNGTNPHDNLPIFGKAIAVFVSSYATILLLETQFSRAEIMTGCAILSWALRAFGFVKASINSFLNLLCKTPSTTAIEELPSSWFVGQPELKFSSYVILLSTCLLNSGEHVIITGLPNKWDL